jgi:universal stress protein A
MSEPMQYRHILLAADLSPDGDQVARRAMAMAAQCGATLSLVHVVSPAPVDPSADYLVATTAQMDIDLARLAREQLADFARRLALADARQWVRVGSVKGEIVQLAEQQGVDLIVVGSHGRHGLGLLFGSTADAVLRAAPCDILAVRCRA